MNVILLVLAHFAMVFVGAMWSIQNVLAEKALERVHPLVFATFRDVGAVLALALNAFVVDRGSGYWRPRGCSQWCKVAAGGIFAVGGIQLFYLVGLSLTSSTESAIFGNGIPVITGVAAFALGRESFSCLRLAGIVIATAGLIGTTVWGALEAHASADRDATMEMFGTLALLANVTCCSLFYIMLKPLKTFPDNPATASSLIAWLYFFGAASLASALAGYAAVLAVMYTPGTADVALGNGTGSTGETRGDAVWDGLQLSAIFPLQDNLDAIGAIAFAALIGSALSYALMTWANAYVEYLSDLSFPNTDS